MERWIKNLRTHLSRKSCFKSKCIIIQITIPQILDDELLVSDFLALSLKLILI
jgi:hypothetical protein